LLREQMKPGSSPQDEASVGEYYTPV
jgi:hypothetical protein